MRLSVEALSGGGTTSPAEATSYAVAARDLAVHSSAQAGVYGAPISPMVGTVAPSSLRTFATAAPAPAQQPAAIGTPSAFIPRVSAPSPVMAPGTGAADPGGTAGGLGLTARGLTSGANFGTIALVAGGLFLLVVLIGRRRRR